MVDYDMTKSDWQNAHKEIKVMWFGINLHLLPEFLGGVLGICTRLIVHLIFGLRWLGTLSIAFLVGVLVEAILNFMLPILVMGVASIGDQRSSGGQR